VPRGGKRFGAGRKPGPTLTLEQSLWIGAECVRVYRESVPRDEAIRLQLHRRAQRSEPLRGVLETYELLDALSPEHHKRRRHEQRDEWVEDVRAMRQELLGGELKLIPLPGIRPKRTRTAVLKEVAESASVRFSCRVTARMVRTCWQEYNHLRRRLEQESPSGL
jgi:hypothetical protein